MEDHLAYFTFSSDKVPKKRSKSHVQCYVYGYTSRLNCGLYKLPDKNDDLRRKEWISKLRLGKVKKNVVVCGKHFKEDDFKPQQRGKGKIKRLKNTAVPSQNLPKSIIHKSPSSAKKKAIQNRQICSMKRRLILDQCDVDNTCLTESDNYVK